MPLQVSLPIVFAHSSLMHVCTGYKRKKNEYDQKIPQSTNSTARKNHIKITVTRHQEDN